MSIIIVLIYLVFQVQNDVLDILLLMGGTAIACAGLFINNVIRDSVALILFENIELQKYYDYFLHTSSHLNGKQRAQFKSDLILANSQIHFYRGEFQKSLDLLNQIDISQVTSSRQENLRIQKSFYEFLNKLHLGNTQAEAFEEIPSDLKESRKDLFDYLQFVKACYQEDSREELKLPAYRNRLGRISLTYYQAVATNTNDRHMAAKLFQEIRSENPELFYVQEAQKYLEDMEG